MPNTFILTEIEIDDFKAIVREIIEDELKSMYNVIDIMRSMPKDDEKDKLLTRKEAAQILSVCTKTLLDWTKEGKIIGYRIGSRVRYKKGEILTALGKIKTSSTQ